MQNSLPEGFAIPVRRSLSEPILLGGAPRTAAILNGTLAAAFGLGLQLWALGIAYWIVAHTLCVVLAKRDPDFIDILIRHIKQPSYFS